MNPAWVVLLALSTAGCTAVSQESEIENGQARTGWAAHAMDRPHPEVTEPTDQMVLAAPPPNAVVLFDGTDLSRWTTPDGGEVRWAVRGGYFEVTPGTGTIRTRDAFGDVQLHIEWASPSPPEGTGQDRGNSGVFLMGIYEVQVLDSYRSETYADGQAAAIYGQYPPRLNVSRPPGEWQTFDIFFRRPRFAEDGSLLEAARMTVLHNGVLVQNNEELLGPTAWLRYLPYEPHADELPIELQDHGSPVRFRNVWALPLPELTDPEPAYATRHRPLEMSGPELDRFVGRYDRPGAQAPITISREGETLHADFFWRPGTLELIPVAEAEFVLAETDGRLVFELDDRGTPASLVFHLGGARMPARRAE
jgi:hypothetical protein